MFEVVDGGGQHQFTELAEPSGWPDSGPVSALDGRKRTLSHPALPVEIAVQPRVVGVVVGSEQSVFDEWTDAL